MEDRKTGFTQSDRIGETMRAIESDEIMGIYSASDLEIFGGQDPPLMSMSALDRIDDFLERDKQREADGFPRKIRVGQIVKPGQGKQGGSVIVVPTTEEDKLVHGQPYPNGEYGGQGGEEEGEVIAETDPEKEGGEDGEGSGQGGGGQHEVEKRAYDLGRILTETFELPNIKDKHKHSTLYRETYDLVDRSRGGGQILNKMATLKRIVKTNSALGRLDPDDIDPSELLVSPSDRVYNVLSSVREYLSQAVVFFVRDYSGSMYGSPAEAVCRTHLLIYSWLMYQYQEQVKTRFILHDTEAEEVPDFHTYYSSNVAGGTHVRSGLQLVCDRINGENLHKDYNVYVFYGTDGDDWDDDGAEATGLLWELMHVTNRIGITIARNSMVRGSTVVENYIRKSDLLIHDDLIRLDSFLARDASEERIIEGIKTLIS